MAWPTDDLTTDHFDAGADSPAHARPVLKKVIDYLKAVLDARAAANGLCELDAHAQVPGARIGRGAADGTAPLDAASKLPRTHLPGATATDAGAARLATDAEAENASGTGILQARQLTLRTATAERAGLLELATDTEAIAGLDRTRAMTPAADKAALDAAMASLTIPAGGITGIRSETREIIEGANGPKGRFLSCSLGVRLQGSVATVILTNHYLADDSN